MDFLMNIVQGILGMGAAAMLPIMITILGVVFRMKFGEALRAGLLVGIGFTGLGLVINKLMETIQPAIDYYAAQGSGFTTIDLGWATVGAASWTVPWAALLVPIAFALNIIAIRLKLTHVMNVDLWNFIHFLIPGALATALFNSPALGLIVAIILSIVAWKGSEYLEKDWQEQYGLDGTTCSTASYVMLYPITKVLDRIYDFIPGLNNVHIDVSELSGKLGVFGETSFMGCIVGLFLGLLTRQPLTGIVPMMIGFATVLVLIPRMVAVMMEGLTPIGNAANAFMSNWLGGDEELTIGMDVCLGLGDPNCIVATAIFLPVTILLAFVLPGQQFFPLGMLSGVCYTTVIPTMTHRGNFLRICLSMLIMTIFFEWAANYFTPEATAMMRYCDPGTYDNVMVTDQFFGLSMGNVIIELLAKVIR